MDYGKFKKPCRDVITNGVGFLRRHLDNKLIEMGHEVI